MNTNVLESVLPLSDMLLSRINFWGFLPYILLWLQNKNMPPAPYFKFFVFFWLIYPYFFICSKMSSECFSFLKPSLTIPTWPLPLCHLICCGQASHYAYVYQQISTKLSDFFSWKTVSCLRAFHVFSVSYFQPPALCVALSAQKYCSS